MRPLAYTLRASPGVLVGLHVGESLATREAATPDPPSDSPRSLYVTNGTAPRARTYARDRESSPAPRSGIHARPRRERDGSRRCSLDPCRGGESIRAGSVARSKRLADMEP